MSQKFRLVTRSDFDGLVCAALMKERDMVDEIKFVHPKDMQDGKIAITDRDITANLPYVPGAHMVFDHHKSEAERVSDGGESYVNDPNAPSAARVIYEYFGGGKSFTKIGTDLMEAVDKADSAQFTEKDILKPEGWELLSFIMDSRTGLGRFRDFRISNYELMMALTEHLLTMPRDEIMALPDVAERTELYREHEEKYTEQVQRCSTVHDNLVVFDMRTEDTIYAGNRFVIYGLYPLCNISIMGMWGLKKQNVAFAIGKSIINRTSRTDIGRLCLEYGGGGHEAAGTCQVETERADAVLQDLIKSITADG